VVNGSLTDKISLFVAFSWAETERSENPVTPAAIIIIMNNNEKNETIQDTFSIDLHNVVTSM